MSRIAQCIVSTAIATTIALSASTASAGSLGAINAMACGAGTKASRVAKPTGAVYHLGHPATIAAELDRDFPAMVKLKMITTSCFG